MDEKSEGLKIGLILKKSFYMYYRYLEESVIIKTECRTGGNITDEYSYVRGIYGTVKGIFYNI